jgi:copper(I)-binding protein
MRILTLAAAAALFAIPLHAHDGVKITDAYVRALGTGSGAAFFVIDNHSDQAERLTGVRADIGTRAELHTHKADASGMMQMLEIEGGIPIAPNGSHALARGGDHVMLFGMPKLEDGTIVTLTLTFDHAGEVIVEAPVDNARMPGAMDHGAMDLGKTGGADHAAMGHGPGPGAAIQVDQTGMTDEAAIEAQMRARFDRPEAPLSLAPIVVAGDHAIAGWAQGDQAGRALLRKGSHGWAITLCAGKDLRDPAFLAAQGIDRGSPLSRVFNLAEDALGAAHVESASAFEGVVRIGG